MSLCLTITSYHKITPGQIAEKSMDNGVMAIGRSPENDWVLPDPERLVSSRHCVVQYKDGRYYLTDNSTNGVELVNAGIRLRRGNSEPLEDGELIRIGDYEIRVRISLDLSVGGIGSASADASNSFDALMGRHASPAPAAVQASPAAPFQSNAADHTFPDLFDFLTPPAAPPATQSDHVPAERHDFRPPAPKPAPAPVISSPVITTAPAPGVIPEDWDPFADIPAAPVVEPFAPIIEVPIQQAEPVFVSAAEPVLAPFDLPCAAPDAPLTPSVQVAAVGSQGDALAAFLRGAGLDHLSLDSAPVAAQMEAIGRSYRLMVEGLIDVLRARSSIKGEFRLQQTMIAPVENNPLKFAPNADEALLLLLRHGNQAFMPPDQAVADSFDDLRAHQLAVMAGVEAAIKALLKRFEPAELETRIGKPGALSNLFGSRQSQYWEQFTELYTQISHEAEEDFQVLFGREFSRAYEEHSARLRRP